MSSGTTVFEDIRRQASIEKKKSNLKKRRTYKILATGTCEFCDTPLPRGTRVVILPQYEKVCDECIQALHEILEEERRKK